MYSTFKKLNNFTLNTWINRAQVINFLCYAERNKNYARSWRSSFASRFPCHVTYAGLLASRHNGSVNLRSVNSISRASIEASYFDILHAKKEHHSGEPTFPTLPSMNALLKGDIRVLMTSTRSCKRASFHNTSEERNDA